MKECAGYQAWPFLVAKNCYIAYCNQVISVHFQTKHRTVMEQQNTGQRALDSIERAKLGIKVFNMPFDQAEEVIDDYVSHGNYDPASVELFKEQLDTQRHIQEKSVEVLSTGAQILRLVVNAVVKNMPSSTGDTSNS